MKCQEQKCSNQVLARKLCRLHYNRLYWSKLASPETLQNKLDGIRRNTEAKKLPGYVPRSERPKQTLVEKKARVAQQMSLRRHIIRDIIDQIKCNSGCIDCGYTANPIALDFDHIENKSYNVARMVSSGRPVDVLIREIQKCEIRCANCHRIITRERYLDTG